MPSRENVEDIYRLSELQESLLLHRLQDQRSDAGHLQVSGRLAGRIDDKLFRKAWQAAVERHQVLRSAMRWQKIKHPVQMVLKSCAPEIHFRDWRNVPPADQASDFDTLVAKDRKKGIDVTEAPAMRFYVVRTARRNYRFLWSCHHLFLDGWSCAIVLRDVLAAYEASRTNKNEVESSEASFRDYVIWSRNHDDPEAREFWKATNPAGGLLLPQNSADAAEIVTTRTLRDFSPAQVESWAKERGVTPNTFFLAVWSLLLSDALDASHAVFGLTVSGRSVPIEGIENMAGMFSNTLPFVGSVDPTRDLDAWVREVFERQQAIRAYESCPLGRILEWAGQPLERAPFDTLFVFANFPIETSRRSPFSRGLVLEEFDGDLTSAFPLTLALVPGASYRIELHSRSTHLDAERVAQVLVHFETIAACLLRSAAGTTISCGRLPEAAYTPRPSSTSSNIYRCADSPHARTDPGC